MKVGEKGTVKTQFAVSDSDLAHSAATQIAIGYDYALDENTTLYVAYAQVDNELLSRFSVNGKGHGDKVVPMWGDDPSSISFGIISKFDFSLMK